MTCAVCGQDVCAYLSMHVCVQPDKAMYYILSVLRYRVMLVANYAKHRK